MKLIKRIQGFTLIELMIVVAIIGILAAIAIPQFASLVAKSQEGRTKANLGTIRSALSIYYGDMEGSYPIGAAANVLADLALSGKYLVAVPNADLPRTGNNSGHPSTNTAVTSAATDAGGWVYENRTTVSTWGRVAVNCDHMDTRGTVWSVY
jgi:prepilin-type N-terminal cleavage/methylation domain-containing protein